MDNYNSNPFPNDGNNDSQNNYNQNNYNQNGYQQNANNGYNTNGSYNQNNNYNNNYNNGYNNNNNYNNGYNNPYNNNGYYNNGYNGYNNGYPSNQSCPSFALWLALSIACAIFASKICGIIGAVYIILANNAYKKGISRNTKPTLKQ